MSMMEVQKYLLSGKTFDDLTEELGIAVKRYPEDGLVLLDYSQIDSPKTHPIVIECRSLILNMYTLGVVSRKYNRFFNYGEAPDYYSNFDFSKSLVMEKVDGSLIGVYFNRHTCKWEISTRGMAKADGDHAFGGTFRDHVLKAFGFGSEDLFQLYCSMHMNSAWTYVFEYIGPENRVVTRYEKAEMVLTGVTECDGYNIPYDRMCDIVNYMRSQGLNVRVVKVYDKTTDLDALVEVVNSLPNLEEGFVVWDPESNKRVKLKAQNYLVAHRMKGNDSVPTRKNILSLVLEGEVDEFLAYFPEWKVRIDPVASEVACLEANLYEMWETLKHIEDQKEFALKVKDVHGSSVLFQAKKLKACPVKIFHSMELNRKLRLMGV